MPGPIIGDNARVEHRGGWHDGEIIGIHKDDESGKTNYHVAIIIRKVIKLPADSDRLKLETE